VGILFTGGGTRTPVSAIAAIRKLIAAMVAFNGEPDGRCNFLATRSWKQLACHKFALDFGAGA